MPGKAKRKGKHPQSKKSKAILRQGAAPRAAVTGTAPAPGARPPAAEGTERPVAARPVVRAKPAADVTASAERYPFFVAELKRIGILAGIIIVILVVLSIVFS
jgi:hypothetical protein